MSLTQHFFAYMYICVFIFIHLCFITSTSQATENQVIKKKMLNAIFPDLKTDSNGVATYNGVSLSTSAGPCVAQNKMPDSLVG